MSDSFPRQYARTHGFNLGNPRSIQVGSDGALHVIDLDAGIDRRLVHDEHPDVHWGLAEFIAAEEMERRRGYWWSPDGRRMLVCRVDERPVQTWHIANLIDPGASPRAVRYPRAGTDNAIVTLHVVGVDGARVGVDPQDVHGALVA